MATMSPRLSRCVASAGPSGPQEAVLAESAAKPPPACGTPAAAAVLSGKSCKLG